MGAVAAIRVLHRRALAEVPPESRAQRELELAAAPQEQREALRESLIEEQIRVAGGVHRALEIGVVDDVVDPAETRKRIAAALAAAPAARGAHGNIPL